MERVPPVAVACAKRPAVAAPGIATGFASLGAAEIGEHLAMTPADRALIAPAVEVGRVAANVDHPVDQRRPAEPLAARAVQPPAAKVRFRLAEIAPIESLHVHGGGEGGRH